MTISKSLIAVFITILSLFACSAPEEDENVSPKDSIQDGDGIRIELEWNTGGSVNQSIDDADLDLILTKDNKVVVDSDTWYSFESVDIENIYADGDYYIDVAVIDIVQDASYTLYVSGFNGNDNLSYTGSLTTSDDEITIQYLKIVKKGTQYTIVDL